MALLKEASESGDAPKPQVAFLTDRIRFNAGRPQVYGTVLDWNESGELACDVEDYVELAARRNAMDLAPLQEDLEKHRLEVQAEGGRPPADYAQYKKQGRGSAENAGWR